MEDRGTGRRAPQDGSRSQQARSSQGTGAPRSRAASSAGRTGHAGRAGGYSSASRTRQAAPRQAQTSYQGQARRSAYGQTGQRAQSQQRRPQTGQQVRSSQYSRQRSYTPSNTGVYGGGRNSQFIYGKKRNHFGKGPIVGIIVAILVIILAVVLIVKGCSKEPEPVVEESPQEQVVEQPPEPYSITVSAVGDMIFDRVVGTTVDAQGGAAPFAYVTDELNSTDVTVGNLECPLATGGDPKTWKDIILLGRPAAAEGIASAGFDMVSLANNHMMDYGGSALNDTLVNLDNVGVRHTGAGMTAPEARTPAVFEVEGKTIAYLAYSDIIPNEFLASATEPGIAGGRTSYDDVAEDIRNAKAQYDFVFVSLHGGVEYETSITGDQQTSSHMAIDAGADAVLNHHPHTLQGVEFYHGKLIAYSLGNFIFNQWEHVSDQGMILQFELTNDGIQNVTVIPTAVNPNGQAEILHGDSAAEVLNRLTNISAGMNVDIRQENDRGYITALS